MSKLEITTDSCNLGEGRKVEIVIDEMNIWSGLKMKLECRFSGGKQSSAQYIRKMRKRWRDGELLDMLEGRYLADESSRRHPLSAAQPGNPAIKIVR